MPEKGVLSRNELPTEPPRTNWIAQERRGLHGALVSRTTD